MPPPPPVVRGEPAVAVHLHGGETEAVVERLEDTVALSLLNTLTGDRFRRVWNEADIAELLPLAVPRTLRELRHFETLLRGVLAVEAGFSGAAESLGPGTELIGRSWEEPDTSSFALSVTLKAGQGILAQRHEFTMQVPISERATPQRRHELAMTRVAAERDHTELEHAQQLAHLRSLHRRTVVRIVAVALLASAVIATVVLSRLEPPDDGSASQAATNEEEHCFVASYVRTGSLRQLALDADGAAGEIAVIVLGSVMLLAGHKLVAPLLFAVGGVSGAALCYALVSMIYQQTGGRFFSCAILSASPAVGAVLGGIVAWRSESVACALTGCFTGAALGYYVYVLFVGRLACSMEDAQICTADPLALWLSVGGPSALAGLAALRYKEKALSVCTAVIGGTAVTVGAVFLALARRDARWATWLAPHLVPPALVSSDLAETPFVLGPVVCALVLSALGTCVQLRCQRQANTQDARHPIEVPQVGLSEMLLPSVVDDEVIVAVEAVEAVQTPPDPADVITVAVPSSASEGNATQPSAPPPDDQ